MVLLPRIQYGDQKKFVRRKSDFAINITAFYFRTIETLSKAKLGKKKPEI